MKTIIVTGASGGIGRAVAERFLDAGWRVGLIARREALLHRIAEGRDSLVLPCDVTDPAQVEAAFSAFAAQAGRLDVLFNNAGIFTPPGMIDEISLDDWTRAVAVNQTGMFLCARAAFGLMRRQSPQGGRIINNGSVSAQAPREGAVTYTMTKHAISGLTKQLALDGRDFDIACGQIDIGNAASDMTERMAAGVPQADGSIRPEPRMPVEEVAAAVVHMAGLPLSTNVQFMTIMATNMPFIGRG